MFTPESYSIVFHVSSGKLGCDDVDGTSGMEWYHFSPPLSYTFTAFVWWLNKNKVFTPCPN